MKAYYKASKHKKIQGCGSYFVKANYIEGIIWSILTTLVLIEKKKPQTNKTPLQFLFLLQFSF